MSSIERAMGDSLALVNVARQAFGHEPLNDLPRARPGDGSECLYARALKDVGAMGVSGGGRISFSSSRVAAHVAALWGTQSDGINVQAPPQFATVISPFDSQKLPQYNPRS